MYLSIETEGLALIWHGGQVLIQDSMLYNQMTIGKMPLETKLGHSDAAAPRRPTTMEDLSMRLARLKLDSVAVEAGGATVFSFEKDAKLQFRAGQFGVWIVNGSIRPFTFASSPQDAHVQLATRVHDGNAIKRALKALRKGDVVRVLAPLGKGGPTADGRAVVYIAQGIGITTARSLIRATVGREQILLHVGKPYFREELEPLVTTAIYPIDRDEYTLALRKHARHQPDAHYVVSGSGSFAKAAREMLVHEGIPVANIRSDAYIGLSS
ncbi:FAD-dependent oxidoreductase [Arthrobacter sp. SD76]|uniref:FAD-dependent oxidoreductase n=1 Tax=Arthrobacter sp. SD76 TaxID=3415007 RepID=UPI003C788D62